MIWGMTLDEQLNLKNYDYTESCPTHFLAESARLFSEIVGRQAHIL